MSEQIIRRAPDKQLDYIDGFITLVANHDIIYVSVKDWIDNEPSENDLIIEKEFSKDEYEVLTMDEMFKVITF